MQIKHENTVIHENKGNVTEQWPQKTENLLGEREQFSQSLDEKKNHKFNKAYSSSAIYVEVSDLLKKKSRRRHT